MRPLVGYQAQRFGASAAHDLRKGGGRRGLGRTRAAPFRINAVRLVALAPTVAVVEAAGTADLNVCLRSPGSRSRPFARLCQPHSVRRCSSGVPVMFQPRRLLTSSLSMVRVCPAAIRGYSPCPSGPRSVFSTPEGRGETGTGRAPAAPRRSPPDSWLAVGVSVRVTTLSGRH